MINVQKISKRYGKKQALKGVSFQIESGEIVGFLGRNGAGKTSLMRIISGFLYPDDGEVFVNGHSLSKDMFKAQSCIGYLPETPPLYPDMRVEDYLAFAARLRDVAGKSVRAAVDKAISDCRINDVRRQVIGTLSKGYKQRVGIAQAVIHDPAVLILDEPTSGLDPVQITHIRELIKSLEGSRTVIISTHILPEIQSLVKRVLIIKNGELVVDERLDRLAISSVAAKRISLRLVAEPAAVERMLADHPYFRTVLFNAVRGTVEVELEVIRPLDSYNNLLHDAMTLPGRVVELREHVLNLEEIFLKLHE